MQKKSEDCVSRCLSRREAEEIDSFSMCQLLYVQNIFFFIPLMYSPIQFGLLQRQIAQEFFSFAS